MCRFFHSAMRLHHHRLLRGTWGDLAGVGRFSLAISRRGNPGRERRQVSVGLGWCGGGDLRQQEGGAG